MAVGGALLRVSSTLVRALQLLCSILVLGIFSYFLAVLADHHLHIVTWAKAVEGISGGAVIYTAFAVILTCLLGGVTFFAFLALLMDALFIGGFVAIAVLTRAGAHSCSGNVSTPLGSGNAKTGQSGYGGHFGFSSGDNLTYVPNLGRACKLEKAVFATSVAAALLFLISAVLQILLSRHHKKEKRYGPGPSNNYTSGKPKKSFWKRSKKTTRDAELGVVGTGLVVAEEKHHHKHQNNNFARPSHDTAMTGSTAAMPEATYGGSNTKTPHDPVPHTHEAGYPSQVTGLVGTPMAASEATYAAPDTAYGGPVTRYGNDATTHTHSGGHLSRDSNMNGAGLTSSEPDYRRANSRIITEYDNNPGPQVHNGGFPHIEQGVIGDYAGNHSDQGYDHTTYGKTNY